jgi:hypothetical protein
MADGTERAVHGVAGSELEICRVRHGRFCDVVPSKLVSNSNYNTHFCDYQYYAQSTGRCVLRSGNNTNASVGFVNVNAKHDASYSNTSFGSRLAFRGEYEFVE